jgi:SAM-dependent MidA family methyltransferase
VSDFPQLTEDAELRRLIRQRMESEGGVTFRDFMAMCLYEPGHGYYVSAREKLGRDGDYLTSPTVSPLFGAMVGRQLREMWQLLGQPARFDILEAGAGTGVLARDLLSWSRSAAPQLFAAIDYSIVEVSEPLRAEQQRLLAAAGLAGKMRWHEEMPPESIEGCILSNELLDSFPVHRVKLKEGRLREVYVCPDGEGFREELRDPSTPTLAAYFERLGLQPGESCDAEVNLQALDWLRETASALRRGVLLTFDYGYEAADLYAPWRSEGTLLCFYRHAVSGDPYQRIGRQDMTSHVDFTSLRAAGEAAGLQTLGLVSQVQLLSRLGIEEALQQREGAALEEHFARRRAVLDLTDEAGLGRIRVLAQARGIGSPRLTGLA